MIQLDTFYNKINKSSYSFGEFIKEFPDFSHYALNSFNEKIKSQVYSNNFAIKTIKSQDELTVYSLLTDLHLNNEYKNLIPDNGCNYIVNIIQIGSKLIELPCTVKIPTYEDIEIIFKLRQTKFKILKENPIKFPDDYFLKGYPILGELVSQSIMNNVISLKDHKKQRIDFRQYCLHKIKEAA